MRQSVIKRGDPLLGKVCTDVRDIDEVRPVIVDMMDTLMHIAQMFEFKRGHGIAAPQIGHLKRLNIVQYDGATRVLINPEIIEHSAEKRPIREGCLSFFDVRGNVPRYTSVTISALDENGRQFTLEASDDFAMLLQHELDHLDGILYLDRLPNGDKDLYPVENIPAIP